MSDENPFILASNIDRSVDTSPLLQNNKKFADEKRLNSYLQQA